MTNPAAHGFKQLTQRSLARRAFHTSWRRPTADQDDSLLAKGNSSLQRESERDLVRFRLRKPWEHLPALPKAAKKSPSLPLPPPQKGRGASSLLIDSLAPVGREDGRRQGEGERPPSFIRSRSRAQFFHT